MRISRPEPRAVRHPRTYWIGYHENGASDLLGLSRGGPHDAAVMTPQRQGKQYVRFERIQEPVVEMRLRVHTKGNGYEVKDADTGHEYEMTGARFAKLLIGLQEGWLTIRDGAVCGEFAFEFPGSYLVIPVPVSPVGWRRPAAEVPEPVAIDVSELLPARSEA